jgi:hypothetical protein
MLIELRNVEKTLPQGPNKIWLLRRIDLDVKDGEFVSRTYHPKAHHVGAHPAPLRQSSAQSSATPQRRT